VLHDDTHRYVLGVVVYVMWKPRSETLKSEWKWIHAAGPVDCTGGGDSVRQYFPRTGSSVRTPSRIYDDWRKNDFRHEVESLELLLFFTLVYLVSAH